MMASQYIKRYSFFAVAVMLQADSIKKFWTKNNIKASPQKRSSKILLRPFSLSAKATQLACAHSYAANAFLY